MSSWVNLESETLGRVYEGQGFVFLKNAVKKKEFNTM